MAQSLFASHLLLFAFAGLSRTVPGLPLDPPVVRLQEPGSAARLATVSCQMRAGNTMAEAEQLAAALGASLEKSPNSSLIQFSSGSRTVRYFLGAYVAVTSTGPQSIAVAPYRSGGKVLVPLRLTVETLGGTLAGSGASLTISGERGSAVSASVSQEVALPADPFERLLYRLENAPIAISDSAKGALIGGAQLELLDASLELVKPTLPVLKALGDSKIIELVGDIPLIGTPVTIVQDAFGASGEIVDLLEWYSSTDKRLVQPMRKGILACDKQLKSKSRGDLDQTIQGLESFGTVATEYQAMGFRAAAAMLKYKASIGRFQAALNKVAEAYGTKLPDPTAAASQPGATISSLQMEKLFSGLMRQANDLRQFASDAAADARAAKQGGGR